MKTIDTSKPWIVNRDTDKDATLEILGPAGVFMFVHDATTEQAQEIADILNKATAPTEGHAAEFKSDSYSVTYRAGGAQVTYTAPTPDEVMKMAAAAAPAEIGTVRDEVSGATTCGEAEMVLYNGSLIGKTEANLKWAHELLRAADELHIETRAEMASRVEDLEKRLKWAQENYSRAMNSCVVLSKEVTKAETESRNKTIEECAAFVEGGQFLHDQAPAKIWAEECAKWMRLQLLVPRATLETRSNCAAVTFFDPEQGYAAVTEYVRTSQRRLPPLNILAYGCPSKAQARRLGAWILKEAEDQERTEATPSEEAEDCATQKFVSETVKVTVVTPSGIHFVGTAGGTGGDRSRLVKTAAEWALRKAGPTARGGVMYVESHPADCEEVAAAAGIAFIVVGEPPVQCDSADQYWKGFSAGKKEVMAHLEKTLPYPVGMSGAVLAENQTARSLEFRFESSEGVTDAFGEWLTLLNWLDKLGK
jgi:hypothetical protein